MGFGAYEFGAVAATGSSGSYVAQPTLSGTLSSPQQSIIIGSGGVGTLSGNTLGVLIVELRLIHTANALLNVTVKANNTAYVGSRTSSSANAVDTVHIRGYGGPLGTTETYSVCRFQLRSGTVRTLDINTINAAENTNFNDWSIFKGLYQGGASTTDITSIKFDSGGAGLLGTGSQWWVWSLADV